MASHVIQLQVWYHVSLYKLLFHAFLATREAKLQYLVFVSAPNTVDKDPGTLSVILISLPNLNNRRKPIINTSPLLF